MSDYLKIAKLLWTQDLPKKDNEQRKKFLTIVGKRNLESYLYMFRIITNIKKGVWESPEELAQNMQTNPNARERAYYHRIYDYLTHPEGKLDESTTGATCAGNVSTVVHTIASDTAGNTIIRRPAPTTLVVQPKKKYKNSSIKGQTFGTI